MQKYVNLVDLVKSFQTSIYLQKSASIQPRTGLSKFAKNWPKVRKTVRTNIGEHRNAPHVYHEPARVRRAVGRAVENVELEAVVPGDEALRTANQ